MPRRLPSWFTPGEERALAGIEEALRRSDPLLASMLASFTWPCRWRRAIGRLRGRLARCPAGRFLTVAVLALTLIVAGVVVGLAQASPPSMTRLPGGATGSPASRPAPATAGPATHGRHGLAAPPGAAWPGK